MAYLRIFMGDTLLEQRELTAARTSIGRADDNDIVLEGRGVSKHHAAIERHDDGFMFVDHGSSNGSFIGATRIDRHSLNYWDEIQIFNYVLKFMAVARARGEEVGTTVSERQPEQQEETMELDIASVGDLARLKRRINVASLVLQLPNHGQRRYPLDKVNFAIGKSRGNDIDHGGWFAPRVAARIQRRNDGFYLMPGRRGRVVLNGRRVSGQVRLSDGDHLTVRGLSLEFQFRPQVAA